MALIVYDHLHTLPMEIRYIWSSRRLTMVNVLYYITKYGIFFSAVDLYRTFNHSITVRECQYTAYIYSAFIVSSLWVGEAALGIRVWAISGKKRCLTIALPIIFCALFITYLVFLLDYLGSMEYGQAPAPQLIRCFVTKANKSIDVTLACLPAWVASYKCGGNTRFVRMVYQEGIIYYLYLLRKRGALICALWNNQYSHSQFYIVETLSYFIEHLQKLLLSSRFLFIFYMWHWQAG
ncbi:hypothetical protein M378DRAFT_546138 [Amanita muscaria Koide BX008]|uniref:DUF6533 domain-containing protein n=1 Tax=Amanita muscaria (strain Koide BX008) TaxID=946122 RepID=A0A0C2SPM1_AMAMK|nr:hypothetical protein M378DRAFT_546138 [Amanita muscaria Koide BX008]